MAAKIQGEGANERGQQNDQRNVNGESRGGLFGMNEESMAQALGWFSIGLGLAEVVAPRGLSKLIGIKEDHSTLLRVFGLREIASGIGILTQQRPASWLWARVAGDAIDLACLGAALNTTDASPGRIAAAAAAVAGVTVADVLCGQQLSRNDGADTGASETNVTETQPSALGARAGG